MITEETKIKDLIPEGYEFEEVHIGDDDEQRTFIYFKKKQKDFARYIREYFELDNDEDSIRAINYLTLDDIETLRVLFIDEMYDTIPFEYKIGLLKFICDDLGLYFFDVIANIHDDYKDDLWECTEKVLTVCPESFLKSIV